MKEIKVTDIKGIQIGQAEDENAGTGCTVIICKEGATAGVDVRGGGPATRETDLLNPINMVQQIHAVMLSGGSAFGLDAASGAMQYLEEHDCGFDMQVAHVPIVCGASLFDLSVGDPKVRPDKTMGYQACLNSEQNLFEEGNHGAGTGASVGKVLGFDKAMKSGIGMSGMETGGIQVAAVVAVNACGNVVDYETNEQLAGIYDAATNTIIDAILDEFDEKIGLDRLLCMHINDSKNIKGAKKDRHANIGFGEIGFDKLCTIVHHPRVAHVVKILETPYVDGHPPYKYEIAMLKNKVFDEHLLDKIIEEA